MVPMHGYCRYYQMERRTKGREMHAETDKATYYSTMSRMTGHSVRHLRVRTGVRVALAALALVVPFASALPVK